MLGACALPGFLSGPMVEEIRADFPLSDAVLGLSFSVYWGIAALASGPAALVVHRFGPTAAMRLAGVICALACAGIAAFADSATVLILILAAGGTSVALAAPAVAVLLASVVPVDRRAFAFALSQSTPSLSLVVAGAAVPLLAHPLGWRSVFVFAGVATAALAVVAPRVPNAPPAPEPEQESLSSRLRPLALVMLGIVAGNAALASIQAFLVAAAPSAGVATVAAAVVLAVGSAGAVALRLGLGVHADRHRGDPLPTVGVLALVGALGFALVATEVAPLFVTGALLVLVVGWAWTGLVAYAVVNRYPSAVAAAFSLMQTGFFSGGIIGSLLFGVLVQRTSFQVGWAFAAAAMVICATAAVVGVRLLPDHRAP